MRIADDQTVALPQVPPSDWARAEAQRLWGISFARFPEGWYIFGNGFLKGTACYHCDLNGNWPNNCYGSQAWRVVVGDFPERRPLTELLNNQDNRWFYDGCVEGIKNDLVNAAKTGIIKTIEGER